MNASFPSHLGSGDDNNGLCLVLFLYIPGYSWQRLPAAL